MGPENLHFSTSSQVMLVPLVQGVQEQEQGCSEITVTALVAAGRAGGQDTDGKGGYSGLAGEQ